MVEVNVSTTDRPDLAWLYFEVNLGSFEGEEGILADVFRTALQDPAWDKNGLPKPKNPVLVARFYIADADELDKADS